MAVVDKYLIDDIEIILMCKNVDDVCEYEGELATVLILDDKMCMEDVLKKYVPGILGEVIRYFEWEIVEIHFSKTKKELPHYYIVVRKGNIVRSIGINICIFDNKVKLIRMTNQPGYPPDDIIRYYQKLIIPKDPGL